MLAEGDVIPLEAAAHEDGFYAELSDYDRNTLDFRARFAITGTPVSQQRFHAACRIWWGMVRGYRYVVFADLTNDRKKGKKRRSKQYMQALNVELKVTSWKIWR